MESNKEQNNSKLNNEQIKTMESNLVSLCKDIFTSNIKNEKDLNSLKSKYLPYLQNLQSVLYFTSLFLKEFKNDTIKEFSEENFKFCEFIIKYILNILDTNKKYDEIILLMRCSKLVQSKSEKKSIF